MSAPQFANAEIGEDTIVEPGVQVGFAHHPRCGPARIGMHGILRAGTLIYGDVTIGDYFQSGHYAVIRAKVTIGDYCTLCNHSTLEGIIRMGSGVRIMSHTYGHRAPGSATTSSSAPASLSSTTATPAAARPCRRRAAPRSRTT